MASVRNQSIDGGGVNVARRDTDVAEPAPSADPLEGCKMKKTPHRTNDTGAYGEQLSFLPPPPFCPTWPTKGTLADKALGMMMDGRMIDHPEFENSTRSWRLGAVIFTLRTLGWPIESIDVPSPTEDNPARIIAVYHLPGKNVAQALAALNGGHHGT
jgi:hypothetical protein